MSARSDSTILLVLRDFIARADCPRAAVRGAARVVRAPRPATDDLAQLAASALALGARPRGPVWLLAEDIFSQCVTMNARALRNLGDADVGQALAYEAQLLSGIEAAESAFAWTPVASDGIESEFWITAMPGVERERVDAAIRNAGGRLAGIAHPVGLPRPLAPGVAADAAWKRIETWHELWAEVESGARGPATARVRRADPTRRHREARGDVAPTELLVAGPATTAQPAPSDAFVARLEDEVALTTWLESWSPVLEDVKSTVPILSPPARPVSLRARVAGSIALATVVLGACSLHYATLRSKESELTRELARVSEPAERKARDERAVAAIQAEIEQLRADAAERASRARPAGWTARLPAQLMELLASETPNGLTVNEFELGWRSSAIRGLCVEPHLADRLGGALARAVAVDGFAVSPSTKRMLANASSGLYEFQIDLAPVVEHRHAGPVRGDR